jgi:hypothetical protein
MAFWPSRFPNLPNACCRKVRAHEQKTLELMFHGAAGFMAVISAKLYMIVF